MIPTNHTILANKPPQCSAKTNTKWAVKVTHLPSLLLLHNLHVLQQVLFPYFSQKTHYIASIQGQIAANKPYQPPYKPVSNIVPGVQVGNKPLPKGNAPAPPVKASYPPPARTGGKVVLAGKW